MGTPGRADWLTLRVQNGGVNMNSSVTFNGYIVAPAGTVTISGNSRLTGGIIARNLTLNSGTVTLLPKP